MLLPREPRGFALILFDIVGGCNARCPFCVTGREEFGKRLRFISVADFGRTLDRLMELELAIPEWTNISLHNWGEPILHPDLNGIVAKINERRLKVHMSTNTSKATRFTVSTERFTQVGFSMPGFSQASYDKIHGLRFDHVLANMEATIANMRETGFPGPYYLVYHVYQFNYENELRQAKQWCADHKIDFLPYYAYLNDHEPMIAYLKGSMSAADLAKASRSLFLHYVDDLVATQPKDWECPQWNTSLTISHRSEVVLCCVLPFGDEHAILGSVFDMSREDILARKQSSPACGECMSTGCAYWAHNPRHLTP
jgi:MoaA/NifB/PqqE/SkfB family radical SAM enzyme